MDRYKIWFLKSQNHFFDKDFFPILVFAEYIKYTKKRNKFNSTSISIRNDNFYSYS